MNILLTRSPATVVERLAALRDAIFAAMTLMVLDLRVPRTELVHSDPELGHALVGALGRQIVMYIASL